MRKLQSAAVYAALLLALILGDAPDARAQTTEANETTWITDGDVYAIVRRANTVYIGGDFHNVGANTGGGAPIAIDSGVVEAPTSRVEGTVFACASDGAGGWYIGGDFTKVGTKVRNGLAYLLADGSVDDWNPNPRNSSNPGEIYALALDVTSARIYVGGRFTEIAGEDRDDLAALDVATGNTIPGWSPNPNDNVHALAVSGTTLFVGGEFTEVGGVGNVRNRIAAIDANGGALPWNPGVTGGANPFVKALAISGSKLYVGGNFTTVNGLTRNQLAAIDVSTAVVDGLWDPNASGGVVEALAVSDSMVFVGGGFTLVKGQTRNRIAALNPDTGIPIDNWDPDPSGGLSPRTVDSLVISGSTLYVGGNFDHIADVPRLGIAALDAATGGASLWQPGREGLPHVYALAVSAPSVYAGGSFDTIGWLPRNNAAAFDATTGRATVWNPNVANAIGSSASVRSLAVLGSQVFIGGDFELVDGQNRENIASVDSVTGAALNWTPDANGQVDDFAISGRTLYVAGSFTELAEEGLNYAGAVDAITAEPKTWDPNADGRVIDLEVWGSTVFAGGEFTNIGRRMLNYLAALDDTTGDARAWWNAEITAVVNGHVGALSVADSTLYAGGRFALVKGDLRGNGAAFDAASGTLHDWDPRANSSIFSLAARSSVVYAGGQFGMIGGDSRSHLAALQLDTGDAAIWNPSVNPVPDPTVDTNTVYVLAISDPAIYVGGKYTIIGNERRKSFAEFDVTPVNAAGDWDLYP